MVTKDSFTSFPIFISLFSYLYWPESLIHCCIEVVRGDILALFLVLGGNCSGFHPLIMKFIVGFCFCCCRYYCFCLWCTLSDWGSFQWAEWVLSFSNNFSASVKIIFLFYFCNVVNYIDFQMLNHPCVLGLWCSILFIYF